jgi:agmatine deiminase
MTTTQGTGVPRAFSMPPEWAAHAAVWTGWPADDELWVGELEGVRREFAAFVRALSRFEPVELIVGSDEAERDAARRLGGARVRMHRVPHDDVWLRDSGPIFVGDGERLRLLNWIFNGWGGKYAAERDNEIPRHVAAILDAGSEDVPVVLEGGSIDVNGAGTLLTTRQCLLTPTRNPSMTEGELAAVLRERLGATQVIWLDEGLEGDHTDGHIDTISRFTDTGTVVTVVSEDPDDTNYAPMQANLDRLRAAKAPGGQPFRVVPLPLPRARLEFEGGRLPLTYANFYIANGGVIVPTYGDANDERALEILRPLFPGREVVGLTVRHLITGGGAFHCVTQQQPAGRLETIR